MAREIPPNFLTSIPICFPPLLQGRRRPCVPDATLTDAVIGQGENAAPAPAEASSPGAAASSQPLRPWNLRTACGEIGRFGEGIRVGGWRLPAAAGGPTQEEGLLRHAHEGRDC